MHKLRELYSKWFIVIFIIISVVYFGLWFYGILLAQNNPSLGLPVIGPDSPEYANLSDSLLFRQSFVDPNNISESFRTPGYPFFTSLIRFLFGGSFFGITFIQIILVLTSAVLIEKIARKIFNRTSSQLASLIFLGNPMTIALTMGIVSDILFVFLYMVFLWLIICKLNQKYWLTILYSGIICALALYVRPMGIFALPIFLAPVIISNMQKKKMIIAMISISIIIFILIVPWMIRNYKQSEVFGFTSLASYNLAYYNIPLYLANKNYTSIDIEQKKIEKEVGIEINKWRYISSSKKLNEYSKDFLIHNLFGYTKYHLTTSIAFFFASEIEMANYIYSTALHKDMYKMENAMQHLTQRNISKFVSAIINPWWKFSERIALLILWLSAIYTIWKYRKNKSAWVFISIIIYLALLSGPVSNARYRLSSDPLFYILTSVGLVHFFTRFKVPDSK